MTSRQKVVSILKPTNADRPKALTLYVVFSISVLIIYTITEQVLTSIYGISHDTLTTCIFSAFGGEILACALIKIFKLKSNDDIETQSLDEANSREG